jgi:hypothetical protein
VAGVVLEDPLASAGSESTHATPPPLTSNHWPESGVSPPVSVKPSMTTSSTPSHRITFPCCWASMVTQSAWPVWLASTTPDLISLSCSQ